MEGENTSNKSESEDERKEVISEPSEGNSSLETTEEAINFKSDLSAVVLALLDTLDDKSDVVKKSVIDSIKKVSKKSPSIVIEAAVYFWQMHRKIPESHLIYLLDMMTDICSESVASLSDSTATSVADLALAEIVGKANTQASELLVALSKTQCSQAVGSLIIKFDPGVIPHHSIVTALGMIAAKNYIGILPFVKVTLSVLVPLLPDMSNEQLKLASAFTLGKLADAVNDCLTNTDIVLNNSCSKDMFYEEFSTAYEVLTHSWLRTSKSTNFTENILNALASVVPLLPSTYNEKLLLRLTPILLNLCKKANVRLPAARVLAIILNSTSKEDKEMLRSNLEPIHHVLSEIVSTAPFEVSRDILLTHYEVLQCFRAIVVLFPEEGLDRILQQLKSQSTAQRCKALVVLRHLINTLPADDEASLQTIAFSLQDSLSDGSTRQVVGAIVALAARSTFPLLPSLRTAFIKFMVFHCGTQTDEAEACEEALFLLSSTVDGAESWLWPSLINLLLDDTYSASVLSILRALSPLAVKLRSDESVAFEKNFQSIKVLGRCLEILANESNRISVITFLKFSAPLFGHQLTEMWDKKLSEIIKFIDMNIENITEKDKKLLWEEKIIDFLEESVKLEGIEWASKLAEDLTEKFISPELAIFLSAIATDPAHITILIELARTHSVSSSGQTPIADEYARAVGICAKNCLDTVVKLMEEFCNTEDSRKQPVKLLGLVKDTKAAATAEAAKAGLLRAYGEISQRADPKIFIPILEKQILLWVIRQINDCKELSTKESGLIALEQIGSAVQQSKVDNEIACLKVRGNALATLLGLYQFSSGYRPLQLYPLIIQATISLIKIPPRLTNEEKSVLLETTMDRVIAGSQEIESMKLPHIMQQVIEGLGLISSEVVSDSADTLALLVDILLPWMQSKSSSEKRTALFILRTTLRSYYDSLKYTYPGGKLEPGKLIGRFISWSADPDPALRPLVIDCVALALNISKKQRSSTDKEFIENLCESKRIIVSDDSKMLYEGVKNVAKSVCERVASGEIVSLTEGLVEGLLYRGEGGIAASIGLTQLFTIRGSDIPRANLIVIDRIIGQMRQMENVSCRNGAAKSIKSLSIHYPQEVIEHLLQQPLPLDRGTIDCWKLLGNSIDIGSQILELLLKKLDNDNKVVENAAPADGKTRPIAIFSSLAAIVAIGYLLNTSVSEEIISKNLSELFSILLKYLSGWLHADPPMSVISTKFGFVPNRETCKISPYKEVHSVLSKILNIMGPNNFENLISDVISEPESETEENLILTVQKVAQCLSSQSQVVLNLSENLGKLATSTLPAQRAVSIAFYAELIGKIKCDSIWLDTVMNTLHEAKVDSSPLVRKLATKGLTKIVGLEPEQIEEYFDTNLTALLNGLEEPANVDGGAEVVIESLNGISVLLSVKTEKPISPRVVLSLKPFIEKENCAMRLAAISALSSLVKSWRRLVLSSDDDVTDHLLGCIPSLCIKLEDSFEEVVLVSKEVLMNSRSLVQCKSLSLVIKAHLSKDIKKVDLEKFLSDLINCLKKDLPERAEELRNAVVQGYSRSENQMTRATSALILGLFGIPRPEDIQRLLQLLKDHDFIVRARAAHALSLCYTI